jgi:hypothetical protein
VKPNGAYFPAGPTYVLVYEFQWLDPLNQLSIEGWADVAYNHYRSTLEGSLVDPDSPVCGSLYPTYGNISQSSGAVGSLVYYDVHRFPLFVSIGVRWDGTAIDQFTHARSGIDGGGSFKVPASPMGPHTVQLKYGTWVVSKTFTVKPRIRVSPSSNVQRGQTVNVSLRGYAAHESVRIRWKHGTGYTNIATVLTSSTGSANVNVHVPTFVPNGATSVRGDGTSGHAQTNAVTVNGGPFSSSQAKTPTPTPTKTATPVESRTVTQTASPATSTPTSTVAAPTETPSPAATTTVEMPTQEPTTIPEASPVP